MTVMGIKFTVAITPAVGKRHLRATANYQRCTGTVGKSTAIGSTVMEPKSIIVVRRRWQTTKVFQASIQMALYSSPEHIWPVVMQRRLTSHSKMEVAAICIRLLTT